MLIYKIFVLWILVHNIIEIRAIFCMCNCDFGTVDMEYKSNLAHSSITRYMYAYLLII